MQERKLSAVMQGASLGVEAVPPRQRLLHLPRQRLRSFHLIISISRRFCVILRINHIRWLVLTPFSTT